jgi:hypothetical protein
MFAGRGTHRWSIHENGFAFDAMKLASVAALVCLGGTACSGGSQGGRDTTTGSSNGTPSGTGSAGNTAGGQTSPSPPGQFGNSGPVMSTNRPAVGTVPTGCTNLQCQQHACANGSTTVSGTVYDPAVKNPIYSVAVYVPNAPVQPLTLGASCYECSDLYTGHPVVATLTDAKGHFVLEKVPDGANIPLVIQIGKWRKQLTLPMVMPCQDNPLPDRSLSLPKNHMDGDIPRIAISTGGADTLECLLRRVGVDASEYVPGAMGEGRIHIFQGSGYGAGAMGGGPIPVGAMGAIVPGIGYLGPAPNMMPAAPMSSASLWDSQADLMQFDIVLLSCEGQDTLNMNQQAMHDYASAGGRVFASHFHYAWFNTGPYANENLGTWATGANAIGDVNANIATTLPNGAPFPKGQALKDWLGNVGALTNGELRVAAARHNVDVTAMNTPSTTWITADQTAMPPGAVQYFSFNTPTNAPVAGPDQKNLQCGRVVYSDLHVGAASMDDPTMQSVPAECKDAPLSPQEAALEFMLFDLSACLTPDNRPPAPPAVVQ